LLALATVVAHQTSGDRVLIVFGVAAVIALLIGGLFGLLWLLGKIAEASPPGFWAYLWIALHIAAGATLIVGYVVASSQTMIWGGVSLGVMLVLDKIFAV
jgi:hypothetical protein